MLSAQAFLREPTLCLTYVIETPKHYETLYIYTSLTNKEKEQILGLPPATFGNVVFLPFLILHLNQEEHDIFVKQELEHGKNVHFLRVL